MLGARGSLRAGALEDWNIWPDEIDPRLMGMRERKVVSVKGECRTEGRLDVGERSELEESQS